MLDKFIRGSDPAFTGISKEVATCHALTFLMAGNALIKETLLKADKEHFNIETSYQPSKYSAFPKYGLLNHHTTGKKHHIVFFTVSQAER